MSLVEFSPQVKCYSRIVRVSGKPCGKSSILTALGMAFFQNSNSPGKDWEGQIKFQTAFGFYCIVRVSGELCGKPSILTTLGMAFFQNSNSPAPRYTCFYI